MLSQYDSKHCLTNEHYVRSRKKGSYIEGSYIERKINDVMALIKLL